MAKGAVDPEVLEAYVSRVVAEAPPLDSTTAAYIWTLLKQGPIGGTVRPDSPKIVAIRSAEEALAKLRHKFKEALEGCHGCGLSRKVHQYQKGYGTGYHDFADLSPDGAIKVAQAYKKKIAAAEKALEKAKANG